MGLNNFGVPKKEVEFLKKIMKLKVFVEGGTYRGDSAKNMSNKFSKVYTIEKSNTMFLEAKLNIKGIKNINLLEGDTREHLTNILNNNNNILFWLDAHWSGGATYGEDDECPVLEELNIIFSYMNLTKVILIDDARLFLSPPPKPHNFKNWPSINEISKLIPIGWGMVIYKDVIYIYPNKIEEKFKEFIQMNISNPISFTKVKVFKKFIKKTLKIMRLLR
jgi:hypothetical protein